MLFRFRTALMWLLLLALPLQGYAAATMLNCGASHDRTVAMDGSLATLPEALGAHHHFRQGDLDDHPRAAGHHHEDGKANAKCSACAACCVGAALPATALVFADAVSEHAPARLFSIGPIGFLTDGPDRPPRSLLV